MCLYIGLLDRIVQLEERRVSNSKVAGSKPIADRHKFSACEVWTHPLEIISTISYYRVNIINMFHNTRTTSMFTIFSIYKHIFPILIRTTSGKIG